MPVSFVEGVFGLDSDPAVRQHPSQPLSLRSAHVRCRATKTHTRDGKTAPELPPVPCSVRIGDKVDARQTLLNLGVDYARFRTQSGGMWLW